MNTKLKTKEFFSKSKIIKSSIKLSADLKTEESLSKIIDSHHTLEIQPITDRLETISSRLENLTLHNTFRLIREILKVSKSQNLWWSTPMININDDLEIVLEWWNKDRKLTFYVNQSDLEYIKVWGADIDTEMEDGLINFKQDCSIGKLWQWISN